MTSAQKAPQDTKKEEFRSPEMWIRIRIIHIKNAFNVFKDSNFSKCIFL